MKRSMPTIDRDAYFKKIGYAGTPRADLETLRALHLHHAQAIPFENLDPLIGRPVRLDLMSLDDKLVRGGRGGYCFEHNLLFKAVLEALGFRVTGLAARVLWNTPEQTISPRTHMLLRIDLDEESYLADVGFGGVTLTAPLRLQADIEQSTPHQPFRLVKAGEAFIEQVKIREEWMSLYRFDLCEHVTADYEMANWYISTHPASRFVTGLIAALPTPDRRYALRDTQLAVHYLNGATERRTLTSIAELRGVLEGLFRITLPDTVALDAALGRVIGRG